MRQSTRSFSLRLPVDLQAAVRDLAKQRRCPINKVICAAVRHYLEQSQKDAVNDTVPTAINVGDELTRRGTAVGLGGQIVEWLGRPYTVTSCELRHGEWWLTLTQISWYGRNPFLEVPAEECEINASWDVPVLREWGDIRPAGHHAKGIQPDAVKKRLVEMEQARRRNEQRFEKQLDRLEPKYHIESIEDAQQH